MFQDVLDHSLLTMSGSEQDQTCVRMRPGSRKVNDRGDDLTEREVTVVPGEGVKEVRRGVVGHISLRKRLMG